ncbi:hypothetical protein NHP190002_05780 [Helicobacter ailurogastricus]|uniref:type ISP restriction/modification enzyme n=1 Tax=Helicobacter ailurogastricus TaxID=1578720 RepID=UPI00244D7F1B|nr:type ISP restriction/modification enzyme [Helicobacter ailurogastricus]GMB89899.1 hypothetical protein NHP190002_05780 [Helicobacter ailurogastricus]
MTTMRGVGIPHLGKTTQDSLTRALFMATERLGERGVLGFVVNSGFLFSKSAAGVRRELYKDYNHFYILDLRGDLRGQRTKHKDNEGENIFNVQVGIAIVFGIKIPNCNTHAIYYCNIGDDLKRKDKLKFLNDKKSLRKILFNKNPQEISFGEFREIIPSKEHDWFNQRQEGDACGGGNYRDFISLKPVKGEMSVFIADTKGIVSNRDDYVINPSSQTLENTLKNAHRIYHENLANFDLKSFKAKLPPKTKPADAYRFLDTEIDTDGAIGWTDDLKKKFCKKQKLASIDLKHIRTITYRSFAKWRCYFNPEWVARPGKFTTLLPTEKSENVFLCVNGGALKLNALTTKNIMDIHFIGDTQAYPLYSDGKKESTISLSALLKFQRHYQDENITAEDIFYFVYAILHHVGFKEIYRNFLAKESLRVPLARDFKKMSALGKELAQLHLNYESLEPSQELRIIYKGDLANAPDEHYRVSKMQLEKDTNRLIYNEYLSIDNIPSKAWEYTLCGESAIKLYMKAQRVKESKKAKDANGDLIISDHNDFKGGKYIFETLLRVITLSLKSVDLIKQIGACDYRQEKNR